MKPCSFKRGPCQADCLCARCLDPDRYARWRSEHPFEYLDWLFWQIENDEDQEAFDRFEEDLLIEEGIMDEEDRTW